MYRRPIPCVSNHTLPVNNSVLFCSVLFYSILFYSILFYSILFYSILPCSTVLYSLFYSFPYSILSYPILSYPILILFYSILFYSIPSNIYSILFYSILFYSTLLYSLFYSFPYSILFHPILSYPYSILFYSIAFLKLVSLSLLTGISLTLVMELMMDYLNFGSQILLIYIGVQVLNFWSMLAEGSLMEFNANGEVFCLLPKDLQKKVFVFPAANKKAAVKLNISFPHPVTNFTVCMRFNPLQIRSYTLFSYSTKPKGKDFQIVKPNPSQVNLQIDGMTQIIVPREVSTSEWQHICMAWNSTTGLVHFWHNGKLFPRFVMKPGYKMHQNGIVFLGHGQDSLGKRESFVGEMADVNLWLRVLKQDEINLVKKNEEVPNSLVSWRALNYTVWGGVRVEEALHQVS
uniref:Pentraxin (PTX) domain-containing protein n=1 Tax=Naja naja TaxID=35670 RepID=A0A8C6X9P1_NAJNA